MKILICQISPKVGALEKNAQIIYEHYRHANSHAVDICVFPELSITGYLAGDLFFKQSFVQNAKTQADFLIKNTSTTCLLLPTILYQNNNLCNCVIAAQHGKVIGITYKNRLPNYGIFDEKRYFTPSESKVIDINGIKCGIPICEDIWHEQVYNGLKNQGAEILIIPNASPYEKNKFMQRVKIVAQVYNHTKLPIIYCNQALSHDGIVFDGKSFIYSGKINIVCKKFTHDTAIVDYQQQHLVSTNSYPNTSNLYEDVLSAVTTATKEYVNDNGFTKVVIGLSGGIDSAVVAAIATRALGKENVSCYILQSKFTSNESLKSAYTLVKNLDISFIHISIQNLIDKFKDTLCYTQKIDEQSITYQNLQARIRGTVLMSIANNQNALLLTTGNKSEYATGYTTIYGDMNGAFNPIKDLYKTEIFQLAQYINSLESVIPPHIIDRPPSAELSLNQKDSDTLPEYEILDKILYSFIEKRLAPKDLYSKFDKEVVDNINTLLHRSEFKRKQSAPGVKISNMLFDKDRRFPITNFHPSLAEE